MYRALEYQVDNTMKMRSSAKVLIRDKMSRKYLVLQSSKWEENPLRSHQPDLPGGLVEDGETALEGLAREVKEEIGITLPFVPELAYAFSYASDQKSTTFLLYFIEVDTMPEITLSWEHEAYSWMSAEELKDLNIREPYPTIFSYLEKIEILT